MNPTPEQADLRAAARDVLAKRSTSAAIRDAMVTAAGFDTALWKELSALGWPGMIVPEQFGGTGLGWVEASILFEEAGRHLLCAPLLSTTLGITAILEGGDERQQQAWLPGLAAGDVRATVALPHSLERPPSVQLVDGVLRGTATLVVDGATADLLIVAARDADDTITPVVIDAATSGVNAQSVDVMDQTRHLADVTFDGAEATETLSGGTELLAHLQHVAATLLANEQVGVAARALDESTAYAKTRLQFGRAIGSFQAVKHRLADGLVRVEAARSVAMHAAQTLADDDRVELAIAAPMARSLCSGAVRQLTADNIQIHGGIGFTWEHDAHLAFKRAESSRHLFGSPEQHRAALAQALGWRKAATP